MQNIYIKNIYVLNRNCAKVGTLSFDVGNISHK